MLFPTADINRKEIVMNQPLAHTVGPPHAAAAAAREVHAAEAKKAKVDFHSPGRRFVQNE